MVRSAHVDSNGSVYAYVECGAGELHQVSGNAFDQLRDGTLVVDTGCQRERGRHGDRYITLRPGRGSRSW